MGILEQAGEDGRTGVGRGGWAYWGRQHWVTLLVAELFSTQLSPVSWHKWLWASRLSTCTEI